MTPTTRSQPEQLCLPGQAHVAPGPHDQTGMYVMHHAFRRELPVSLGVDLEKRSRNVYPKPRVIRL